MSAWWLFTALGLYPLAGTDEYIWTYPLVPEAEVDTSPSTRLRIEAPGARRAPPAGTVRLWIDGVEHTDPLVRHAQIVDATLRFEVDAP
jgi:putative alpha-1,2-mannosidase